MTKNNCKVNLIYPIIYLIYKLYYIGQNDPKKRQKKRLQNKVDISNLYFGYINFIIFDKMLFKSAKKSIVK